MCQWRAEDIVDIQYIQYSPGPAPRWRGKLSNPGLACIIDLDTDPFLRRPVQQDGPVEVS